MIPFHPFAEIFPLIEGEEFDALVADVKANGLREYIVVHEGQILDGRNRYRAAIAAGLLDADHAIEPGAALFIRYFAKFLPERQGDPLAYVISKNLRRRHLNEPQRASAAAKIANLSHGQRADRPANLPVSPVPQAKAANIMSISERALRSAKVVHSHGIPELRAALDRGTVATSVAEQVALLPEPQQRQVVEAAAGDKFGKRVVVELKKANRTAREAALGAKQIALPQKRYGLILADPEWKFAVWGDGGMDRAPDNHYPTSPTEIIAARDVPSIAAPDSVLLLWVPDAHLEHGFAVMRAWGFTYKCSFVWAKDGTSTGYINRKRHELLLYGTLGKPPAPAPGTQWDSVLFGAVPKDERRHSRKPGWQYELAETFFPSLPKIELNARPPARPGWDVWGNEAEPAHDPETGEIIETRIPEPAEGVDPGQSATGGAAESPLMVARQPGESDAGSAEMESASSAPPAALLAPADRAAEEACSAEQAPEQFAPHDPGASRAGPGNPTCPIVSEGADPGPHPLDIPSFLKRAHTEAAE